MPTAYILQFFPLPTVHSNMLLRCALFLSTISAAAAQEEPTAPPTTVRVRVVGKEDGLPRPGVPLHVHTREVPSNDINADGFLVHEAAEVKKLRAATTVRTDPAGEADLPAEVERSPTLVFAGEPYSLDANPVVDNGVLVWRVFEREPVGVRVLDQNRKPIAGFPVALHSGGRDLSFALTDREGRAVLGMSAEHTARLYLAPAGWIGSHDSMPTIATVLRGRRGAELVVPPHGTLRLRAVRGGRPVRVQPGSFAVRLPDEYRWLANGAANGACLAFGFELPYVAAGVRLNGNVTLVAQHQLDLQMPAETGALHTVDCEVPWQPELRATVTGFVLPQDSASLPLASVRVVLHTNAGRHEEMATLFAGGRIDFSLPKLRGKRLQRVDLDVPATDARVPSAWSASLGCDHDLSLPTLDLGAIVMTKAPPLHGVVVDADGKPVANASVVAEPQPDGQGYQLTTDAEGRFAWCMPLPRNAAGQLLAIRATPSLGARRGEPATFAPGAAALTLVLPPGVAAAANNPAKRPARQARGSVTVVLADTNVDPDLAHSLMLVSTSGFAKMPATPTPGPNDTVRVVFERLEAGQYTLYARDPEHITRLLLHSLDVPDDGACTDARLLRVQLGRGLEVRHIKVVDAQGVPIAGAMVIGPGFIRPTDGTGCVHIATHDAGPLRGRIEVTGHRPLEIEDLKNGLVVQPPKAGVLRVKVGGIPAELPHDRIGIWVRHEQRERMEGPQASLDADGVATVPTPVAAKYVLWLLVYPTGERKNPPSSWRGIAIRPDPVTIGAEPPAELSWELDAETIERLRKELASR